MGRYRDYWSLVRKRWSVKVFFYQSFDDPDYYFISASSVGYYKKLGWYSVDRINGFKRYYKGFKTEDLDKKVYVMHDDVVRAVLGYHALFKPNPLNLKDQTADDEWIKSNTKEIIKYAEG